MPKSRRHQRGGGVGASSGAGTGIRTTGAGIPLRDSVTKVTK
jgi:hypothetical protein